MYEGHHEHLVVYRHARPDLSIALDCLQKVLEAPNDTSIPLIGIGKHVDQLDKKTQTVLSSLV